MQLTFQQNLERRKILMINKLKFTRSIKDNKELRLYKIWF